MGKLFSHWFIISNIMKIKLLLVFLLCTISNVKAQQPVVVANDDPVFKVLDKSEYKCVYSYKYLTDSLSLESEKDVSMVLLIGDSYNLYKNEYKYYIDSLRYLNSRGSASNEQVSESFTQYTPGGPRYYIITNHKEPGFTMIHPSTEGTWESKDVVSLTWELGNDSDSIAGYYCRNAYTSFRGRKYVAWYSPEIPLSYGPYKFSGLPGLILKMNDLQNTHVFEMISFMTFSFEIFTENTKTIKMSPRQLNKALRNYDLGMVEKARQWFPDDPEKVENISRKVRSKNNPIELVF